MQFIFRGGVFVLMIFSISVCRLLMLFDLIMDSVGANGYSWTFFWFTVSRYCFSYPFYSMVNLSLYLGLFACKLCVLYNNSSTLRRRVLLRFMKSANEIFLKLPTQNSERHVSLVLFGTSFEASKIKIIFCLNECVLRKNSDVIGFKTGVCYHVVPCMIYGPHEQIWVARLNKGLVVALLPL